MVINQIGQKKNIGILKRLTGHKFWYYQDTPKQKIWDSLKGGKDDVFIYDTEGELVKHFKARGEENSYMGSGKELCGESDGIYVIKTLLEELKKLETKEKKCNDEFDKDYKEILKLRNSSKKKLKNKMKKIGGHHSHGKKKMGGGKKKMGGGMKKMGGGMKKMGGGKKEMGGEKTKKSEEEGKTE